MVAARAKAVVLSLVGHAAVAGSLVQVSRERPPVVYDIEIELPADEPETAEPEPVEEEPPEEETPPAPPEVARSEPRPAPPADPAPEPASAHESTPLATGVEMENPTPGGGGPAVATPPRPAPARPPAPGRPTRKEAEPAPPPPDGTCAEPASKPKPASRPRDIEYLDDARAREIEGRLVLAVTVAADGTVSAVEVKAPVDPALDAAAVEAVKSWRFEPARRCGKPVEGTFTLARRFVLGD